MPVNIVSDAVVEGDHNFTVAVADGPLVTPGQSTTVLIVDSDCKLKGMCEYIRVKFTKR